MQAIVADTTPLNYLVLIQAADILPDLYRAVLIPPAVKAELAHANTPAIVRAWISQAPSWLEVVSLKQPVDSALAHLDAGEREAISLASELQAILLLMDERDGMTIARHRGLKVVGTLAALDLAAAHGLVDLQTMFERLRATTFRSPVRLMVTMLEQDAVTAEVASSSLVVPAISLQALTEIAPSRRRHKKGPKRHSLDSAENSISLLSIATRVRGLLS
jgi:predicted nucleic acid-binding protein